MIILIYSCNQLASVIDSSVFTVRQELNFHVSCRYIGPVKGLTCPIALPLYLTSLGRQVGCSQTYVTKAARLPFEQTFELKLVPGRVLELPGMKHNGWTN